MLSADNSCASSLRQTPSRRSMSPQIPSTSRYSGRQEWGTVPSSIFSQHGRSQKSRKTLGIVGLEEPEKSRTAQSNYGRFYDILVEKEDPITLAITRPERNVDGKLVELKL
ncbi:hypothetical protein PAXINDRAFT_8540 [Paxillus involutus ATCC 200175]|nr:hypothetical protein PAXINDRAFT_8540 [Paxillus involutus ATCC 200175]